MSLYEVFKRVLEQRGQDPGLLAISVMEQGTVIDLNVEIALSAAKLSIEHRLPLADSVILATTRAFGATLWTQDSDFEGMPSVEYRKRPCNPPSHRG